MHIKFAKLGVDDLDRAIAFYTGGLRLTLVAEAGGGDVPRWAELAFPEGNTTLRLQQRAAPPAPGDTPALCLVVPDVDMAFERLDPLGVGFETEPRDAEWQAGLRYATFRDSEGNLVVLEGG